MFKKLNTDAVSLAFDVSESDLKAAIAGMKAYGIKGMTLTSPHKYNLGRIKRQLKCILGSRWLSNMGQLRGNNGSGLV